MRGDITGDTRIGVFTPCSANKNLFKNGEIRKAVFQQLDAHAHAARRHPEWQFLDWMACWACWFQSCVLPEVPRQKRVLSLGLRGSRSNFLYVAVRSKVILEAVMKSGPDRRFHGNRHRRVRRHWWGPGPSASGHDWVQAADRHRTDTGKGARSAVFGPSGHGGRDHDCRLCCHIGHRG